MLDTVRRYVEAGREALTPKKAEELARALVQQGQARADQVGRIARDLVEWSRKSSEHLRESVGHEVKKQLAKAGVATKDEVEALKRRIRELESQAKLQAKSSAKAAPARRATTQRSAGRTTAKAPATTRTSGSRKSQTSGATRIPKGGTARRQPPPGTRGG